MTWASYAKDRLRQGETVTVKPKGNSMEPRIKSGQEVVVEPIELSAVSVNDVVLCRVSGKDYLHLVKAHDGQRVLIGNNKGHVNGWTSSVYGRAQV